MLLLNLLSLVCVSLLVRWLRNPRRALVSAPNNVPFGEAEPNAQFRTGARFILFSLLLTVIAVDGLAVYGNYQLRAATNSVVAGFTE